MSQYRWNVSDFAAGYDEAAEHIHPFYTEIQDVILAALPFGAADEALIVDAGGGSGRLAERMLEKFAAARVLIVDQSEAFLGLAERRLAKFGGRALVRLARLQDEWTADLPAAPRAIVSMSAIHHLDAAEKQRLYQRCFHSLAPGGVLVNGDEVRPDDDAEYLRRLSAWADHMRRIIDARLVPDTMPEILHGWIERNVDRFTSPRNSGDDCHDSLDAQLAWFASCGFQQTNCLWAQEMWAVMHGVKPQ